MLDTCIQVNLQLGFGGGEVYTAALAEAAGSAGLTTEFCAHADAAWPARLMPEAAVQRISDPADLVEHLRGRPPCWIAFHTFASAAVLDELRLQGHKVTAFAHMPLYGRDARPLRPFDLVIGVSRHVIASLRKAGIERIYPEPMYGVARLDRGETGDRIRARSRYDWDRRKFRDRVLGVIEPLWRAATPSPAYYKRDGLTLGIVSRITPIKQFPLLFSRLAPILAGYPRVNLEIFGSGGYASVRDLDRSLALARNRVRFWGHQQDVAPVYRQIDFLLAGLPEKEALGLNVIEAQACGTPVLAPDAPPFDETVVQGRTGVRYRDPREDDGAGFERALNVVLGGGFRFDSAGAAAHLAQFSAEAFAGRVRALMEALRA